MKIVLDTDKAYRGVLRAFISPDIAYVLDSRTEFALEQVVKHSALAVTQRARLKLLKNRNKKYAPQKDSMEYFSRVELSPKSVLCNQRTITAVGNLRKILRMGSVQRKVSKALLIREDQALEYVQTKIVIEMNIERAVINIDLGRSGQARMYLNNANNALMSVKGPVFQDLSGKRQIINNLLSQLSVKTCSVPTEKTEAEKRKEAEWDQVFKRHKTYIPLHF